MVKVDIAVSLSLQAYKTLKKIAALSEGDMGAAIDAVVKYWEMAEPSPIAPTAPDAPFQQLWRSPRGDMFPVGLKLRADYLHKHYIAEVTTKGIECDGKTYDSPSAAAIAVKNAAGKSGSGANTNGWTFWEMFDSNSQLWIPLLSLKAKK